jgi:hypothetical protein
MEALLNRTMCFDKSEVSIHRQILCHRYICVEANSWQLQMSGFDHSAVYELPPQTLPCRAGSTAMLSMKYVSISGQAII